MKIGQWTLNWSPLYDDAYACYYRHMPIPQTQAGNANFLILIKG